MKFPLIRVAGFALLACLASVPASAEDDDDEQFSQAVREFGFVGGAAWQCAEGDARNKIERQSLASFSGLVRLFGSDEAFFFASAFGSGTSAPVDKAKCGDFITQFEKSAAEGGIKQ